MSWPGHAGAKVSHGSRVIRVPVSGRSFVFFRNPRPDAVDPGSGERYPDVIMFWCRRSPTSTR